MYRYLVLFVFSVIFSKPSFSAGTEVERQREAHPSRNFVKDQGKIGGENSMGAHVKTFDFGNPVSLGEYMDAVAQGKVNPVGCYSELEVYACRGR